MENCTSHSGIYTHNTYHNDILVTLNKDRKEGGFHCDVTLQLNHKNVQVHRTVLVMHSEFFNKMFRETSASISNMNIDLTNLNGQVVENLVEYFYTSKLLLNTENIYLALIWRTAFP